MFAAVEMLEIFQQYRGEAIVIPGRVGRHWIKMTTIPERDVPLADPAMGGHAGFALGLALAQPDKKVILFDSEGDLVMNMGILATIADQSPKNFYHFVVDNECYATTGGQPIPNAKNNAYDVIARGAGYPRAFAFTGLEEFAGNVKAILEQPGPVLVAMKVIPEIENKSLGQHSPFQWMTRSREQVLRDLWQELGISN